MMLKRLFGLLRALRDDRSGAALVEFAICAPLLVVVLVGIVDFGSFMNDSIIVANAARAGVQYGAQNLVTAEDQTGIVSAALSDGGNISGLSAVASYACECSNGSASTCLATDCSTSYRILRVTVTTTGSFPALIPFPGMPNPFSISQTAIRQVAQ